MSTSSNDAVAERATMAVPKRGEAQFKAQTGAAAPQDLGDYTHGGFRPADRSLQCCGKTASYARLWVPLLHTTSDQISLDSRTDWLDASNVLCVRAVYERKAKGGAWHHAASSL